MYVIMKYVISKGHPGVSAVLLSIFLLGLFSFWRGEERANVYLKVLFVFGFTVTAKVMLKCLEIDTVSIICYCAWPFNLF